MTQTPENRFYFFATFGSILFCVALTGCGLMGSQKKPNIQEVPPYYESGRDKSTDFRAYHDRETENMANQVHIVRNREMEKLANSNEDKGEAAAKKWEEDTKATQEKREKFWSKFKVSDKKFMRSDEAARISANLDR